jgi:hypothetical protein
LHKSKNKIFINSQLPGCTRAYCWKIRCVEEHFLHEHYGQEHCWHVFTIPENCCHMSCILEQCWHILCWHVTCAYHARALLAYALHTRAPLTCAWRTRPLIATVFYIYARSWSVYTYRLFLCYAKKRSVYVCSCLDQNVRDMDEWIWS